MNLPAQFETSRLIGRCPMPEDAAQIFDAYASDPIITRYLVWRPHPNLDHTEKWISALMQAFGREDRNDYVLAKKDSRSTPIGMVSARVDRHMANFGYVIRRDHWGQGYASEALRHLVDWALSQEGIFRAWAICDIDNVGSARVMEKAGMSREGVLRSWVIHPNISTTPRDVLCYSKTKEK